MEEVKGAADQVAPPGLGHIALAVCTRGRPRMLAAALASLARLGSSGRNVIVIVVHNDPGMRETPALEAALPALPDFHVIQLIEPQTGIAQARNRAIEEALQRGCRWLAFLDDDEVADQDWLDALLRTAERRRLVLVGGPVRMLPPPEDATIQERIVWRGVSRRFADIERRSARKAAETRDGGITIVTNNWLCDLDFIRRHNLRFDGETATAGGEDTQFHRDVIGLGGATGWAPEAVVHEEWPRERLTLAYQRRRGRDQAAGRFARKLQERGKLALPEAVVTIGARVVSAAWWQLFSLFDGGSSRVRAARSVGAASGILAALRGESSSHYERVTGD
jgi:succinoglycan biosynthesis protein ExoM